MVRRAVRSGVVGLTLCLAHVAGVAAQAADNGAATASEDEEKARAHFRLGRAHYDNGEFAEAAVEFEAAYQISQRAALLYNIYLAYRDANDTRRAAEALRKYLALETKVENRGQLEARLAALDRSLAEEPPSEPQAQGRAPASAAAPANSATPEPSQLQAAEAPAPAPPAAAAGPVTLSPQAPARSVQAEPAVSRPNLLLPLVLMGTGGAMIAGGVVTGILTLSKRADLNRAQQQCRSANNCDSLTPARAAQLNAEQSTGKTLALVTDVLLFGGLAVAGTGAVLFLLKQGTSERTPSDRADATLGCSATGCEGQLRVPF